MIDEKVLIERLEEEKKYCSYHPHTRDETINKAIEIVNQLAEESNNGWIPCSERLPEMYDNNLICTKSGGKTIACVVSECGDWSDMYGNVVSNVIAWQPLPAPYQPKEDKQK